ncbi:MAG TPA: RES domain-containing protein [Gammaproteobacteria bacterium]|nr:RES domain-containing protein [Gammaproteobacteria bacterium]
MEIWAAVKDNVTPEYLNNHLLRIVESQEQIATNNLVDNLEKQAALEAMLDGSKPPAPSGSRALHYLLATPFRYPPLPYGSRFGAKYEPSMFYGSLTEETAFAETGYYRFLFWSGMSTPPPSDKLITQHTIFSVRYTTPRGLKLQNFPFSDYRDQLTNPASYEDTQSLGRAMREHGIDAFEYLSARDSNHGINAALFNASALATTTPGNQRQWICETTHDTVRFYSVADKTGYRYSFDTYLVQGVFPDPAV